MAETIYTYWRQSVDIDTLSEEITNSGIGDNYVASRFDKPSELYIQYSEALSSEDKATLDDVVQAHTGIPQYEEAGNIAVSDGQGGITYVSEEEASATVSGELHNEIVAYNTTLSGELYNKIVNLGTEIKDYINTVSGTINHQNLLNLDSDDHEQYVPTDGSRGFTSTVSGVAPLEDYDLTTREYVLGVLDGSIPPPTDSGTIVQSLIQFHYAEDSSTSSTNSTSYQQKLRLTCSGLPTGNYRIGWTFQWRHSKSNTEFSQRIQVDDTNTIFEYQASPYVDTLYWQPVTGFYYYDVLVSGTHTIDLDYNSSNPGSTSYIKECKMEFWRIT